MYFFKSAVCLAILMLFYKLLLEKENMHVFKRFYLLFAVVASLGIPFITFISYIEAVPQPVFHTVQSSYEATGEITGKNINHWPLILGTIYALGVVFFSVIFIRNLRNLFLKIDRNPKQKNNGVTYVLIHEAVTPHTFWNYVFLNKQNFEEGAIPQEVLEHERAHAVQKHSLDILFIELLQIVFWFYPLIYVVRNAIKLNHEFLADRAVISKGANTSGYQRTLLAFSSNPVNSGLVNSINYSSIKKRFTVMKTKTPGRIVWFRSLLVLPMLAGLIYGFSTTEEVQKPIIEAGAAADMFQIKPDQKKVNAQMLEEYDSLVEHYNSMGDNAILKLRDLERMDAIYNLMTAEQRQLAIPQQFKIAPPPIPAEWSKEKEASPGMIETYNKLVRRYGSEHQKLSKSNVYDFLRMKHIHSLMTEEQKMNAEPLPDLLPSAQQTTRDSISNQDRKKSSPGDGNFVITEDINVQILKDGNLLVNNKAVKPGGLGKRLSEINSGLSPEHQKGASVDVWVEPEVPMEQAQKVEQILRSHGLSQIRIILKSLINVPEEDYFHHFDGEPERTGKFELRKFDRIFRGSDN